MIINFVGDLCLYDINMNNFTIEKQVRKIFEMGDINVANLESPLTESEEVRSSTAVPLKATPKDNKIIHLFNIFSLANNHILDFKKRGLSDTITFLEENNKKYFGSGLNVKEAYKPLKVEMNDEKIAFLGFTRWNNARRNTPGATPMKIKKIFKIVKNLKEENYFVIIMPHWNYEYVYYPAPDYRKYAKKIVDAGADLIVGSHPHIIQGYEKYNGKMIFHSLGNFLFHSKVFKPISMIPDDPRLNISFILQINVKNNSDYDFEIVPIYTDDNSMMTLKGEDAQNFENVINKISSVFRNEKKYKKLFYSDAAAISKQTIKILRKVSKEQGPLNLVRTLFRIKKQDIKVRVFSWLRKNGEKS